MLISFKKNFFAIEFFSNFQEMKEEWDRLLSQNKTGAATNAEDFTKGFMAEMFGKMAKANLNQQPQSQPQPQPQPQTQPQQLPQQQRNVQQVNTNGRAAVPKPQNQVHNRHI